VQDHLADDADVRGRPDDEDEEYAEFNHAQLDVKPEAKFLPAEPSHEENKAPATSGVPTPKSD